MAGPKKKTKQEIEDTKVHDAFFQKKQHASATHSTKSISLEHQNNINDMYNAKMDEKTKAAYANKHPGNPFKEKKKEEKKKEAPLDATAQ